MSAASPKARNVSILLTIVLAVTAVVLGFDLAEQRRGDPVDKAKASTSYPLDADRVFATRHLVRLPTVNLVVWAGRPVTSLDRSMLDYDTDDARYDSTRPLVAPQGGRLVPLRWQFIPTQVTNEPSRELEVRLRLRSGEQTAELMDTTTYAGAYGELEGDARVVALDGRPESGALKLDVEFDGVTQALDLDSGEVDAGDAQALYEPTISYQTQQSADCRLDYGFAGGTYCPMTSGGPALRLSRPAYRATQVTLYPYDLELGWAKPGRLWAGVNLELRRALDVVSPSGDEWDVRPKTPADVTLDGAKPVRRVNLDLNTSFGWLAFDVAADQPPKMLAIAQVYKLGKQAPRDLLTATATVKLVARS